MWARRAAVKGAAALSQVVIAAGSLSGVALILHKKSPLNDQEPLIDYNLVLLMLPALLLGVALGNSICPDIYANIDITCWSSFLTITLLCILAALLLGVTLGNPVFPDRNASIDPNLCNTVQAPKCSRQLPASSAGGKSLAVPVKARVSCLD